MKKIICPVGMIVIGVLICVLAKGVDQRTVVKKKNVKIDQSKLTYDEAEQYRRSLPDREPDNNNLVALKTNLLPYGLPGRQKGWYGDLLAEKLGVEVHYVQPSYFEERDSDMDIYLFFMGEVSYYDAVKAGELLDLEPTLKKNPKIYKRYKNAFQYIKKYTYKKTGKKGIYGFPVNLKSFDDKTMLNEFVEKILVHERARKGSQDTTQEIEIYFNFLGRYIPPSLQPVPLTPEEQEELRKKEERKDRLHQNYLKRKASGAQKRYEDKIKAKKKAEMDAKKALIRAEDMKKGVFSTIGQLPKEEPRKGSIAASAAV